MNDDRADRERATEALRTILLPLGCPIVAVSLPANGGIMRAQNGTVFIEAMIELEPAKEE